jgi:ParB family chromosome partitioning protein
MREKKKKLNRGLDALLGAALAPTPAANIKPEEPQSPPSTVADSAAGESVQRIPLEQLQRGKYQPRRTFAQEALEELAASIKTQGVMQPIVVRSVGPNLFEIVAGERRWRASQLAGLDKIPAVVRDISDEAAIAMALIENIQRQDLNPVEEAIALQRLQDEFGLSQGEVAAAVGKSRPAVANLLRLLVLEQAVRDMLMNGQLSAGHAKVLLALEGSDQLKAAQEVVKKQLSVRQTEQLVKHRLSLEADTSSRPRIDPDVARLERELSERMGSKVQIQASAAGRGKIAIHFGSLQELDGILTHLK